MRRKLLILPHMGLGDTVSMVGMVRRFARSYDHILYVCKAKYVKATSQMFADLPNVDLLAVDDDHVISPAFGADGTLLNGFQAQGYRLLRIGLHSKAPEPTHPIFWHRFYLQAGLSPDLSHDLFHFPRNRRAEEALYRAVVKKHGTRYIVLHNDLSRNLVIDRALLPTNVPVYDIHDPEVRADNLLDYAMVLEKAHAIHCIDSCFALLADRLPRLQGPVVCHAYARDVGTLPGLYRHPVTLWYKSPRGYSAKMS
jgi:hypothetical protein